MRLDLDEIKVVAGNRKLETIFPPFWFEGDCVILRQPH